MKRKFLAAAACVMAVSMMLPTVCFADGTFKVGFDAEFPPYSYMNEDGDYVGFDVDLAKAVAELEGWEFIPAPLVWDSRDDALASGEIDCIWSAYTINGREDGYAWSVPYMESGTVALVKEDSGIAGLADLEGKVVGVQSASSSLDLISEGGVQADLGAKFSRIWQFANTTNEFMALINNNVDAVIDDLGVAQYYVGTTGGYSILSEHLVDDEQCGIAFALGNEALRDTVNDALAELAANGTVAAIAQKYNIMDLVALENVAPAPTEAAETAEEGTEAPEEGAETSEDAAEAPEEGAETAEDGAETTEETAAE